MSSRFTEVLVTSRKILVLAWRVHPRCFTGLILSEILQSIIPLGQTWIIKLIFDHLAFYFQIENGKIPVEFWSLLIGQVVLQLLSQVMGNISNYWGEELKRGLALQTQVSIYDKVNSLQGLYPFEDPKTYDIIEMGIQGAQRGPGQAIDLLTNFIKSTVTLVSFIGILVAFNPLLTLLVIVAALPQLYVQVRISQQRFELTYKNTAKERHIGYISHLLASLYFAKELRLFNLGNYFNKAFFHLTEDIQRTHRAQQQDEIRSQTKLKLLSNLVSSVAFIVVILQAFRGHLTLGDVPLYTSAVNNVQGALGGIIYIFSGIHENGLFFSCFSKLMALPQPIAIPVEPRLVVHLQQGIEFHGVSYRYSPEHPWVLKDVSLTLPAGNSLALVGLNGAGKTTLVKLLTRLYDPTEGQILWDGIDIREFDPVELRRRMGVIFQDFVRFDLTALENIALGDVSTLENGNRAAAEDAARQAAQKAGIHEMVAALPHGYHTTLSRWLAEDGQGVDLSGGEWQKIALARLFMRDADLLILDEPTAAMDAQAEHDIYQSFTDIVAGKTSLLISHRFSTVRMADLIAVLEDGQITEYGSHDELMSKEGTYARLYNMQAERYR